MPSFRLFFELIFSVAELWSLGLFSGINSTQFPLILLTTNKVAGLL